MCANNSQVEFFVGEETPLRDDVKTKTITLGASENTVTTFEAKIKREEIGTDVKIATFINEDRTITLDVDIDISTANLNMTEISIINETTGDVIPFPLDGVNRDSMKSIICARSEQSIAIGGIIRETSTDQETKVPFLGDIPFLGYLFKEKHNEKKKTETVIILTPHIIVHPALAGKTSDAFLNRKSSHPTIIEKKDTLLDYKTRNHPGKIK
jgi:type II secretory pathway component GspD/PulD (secretin)